MRVAAILTAAGSGTRLGHDLPKALVPMGGVPLVVHAARGLADSGVVDLVVVTVPRGSHGAFATAFTQDSGRLGAMTVTFAVGGSSRQASVAAGLAEVPPDVDLVLVHDAARPLTPARLVAEVVAAVRAGHHAVIPVVPVTDSVVDLADGAVRPVDRSTLRGVQTPQGFDRALLDRAHTAAAHRAVDEQAAATDDASLCVALGSTVHAVPGSADAFKITTRRDLALGEVLLSEVPA